MSDPNKKSLKSLKILNTVLACTIFALCVYIASTFFDLPQSLKAESKSVPLFGMQGLSHTDLTEDLMVLNIFASWCVPCRAEHPVLLSLSHDLRLPVYGIALRDTPKDVARFIDEMGNPYKQIGMDHSGMLTDSLDISGVPETLLINKNLEILWRSRGPLTPDIIKEQLQPLVQKLQESQAP